MELHSAEAVVVVFTGLEAADCGFASEVCGLAILNGG